VEVEALYGVRDADRGPATGPGKASPVRKLQPCDKEEASTRKGADGKGEVVVEGKGAAAVEDPQGDYVIEGVTTGFPESCPEPSAEPSPGDGAAETKTARDYDDDDLIFDSSSDEDADAPFAVTSDSPRKRSLEDTERQGRPKKVR
jgi:hypothetical protein